MKRWLALFIFPITLWAQEKPQYLFYFQDDSTTGAQELSLGASGFHVRAPLYQKRLCIRKMGA